MATNTNPLTGEEITDESLSSLAESCEEKAMLMKEITYLEEKVSELKKKHKHVDEVVIPDKMQELGLSSITLADGRKVEVSDFYSGSLVKGNEEKAFEWLEENKLDGIVKVEVKTKLARGEKDVATQCFDAIRAITGNVEMKQSIHAMTMKSFVRERLEGGESLPEELFKVYQGKKTKLK